MLPPDAVYVLRFPVEDGGTDVGDGPGVTEGLGVGDGPGPGVTEGIGVNVGGGAGLR